MMGFVLGAGVATAIWLVACFRWSWKFSITRDAFRSAWRIGSWWGKPGLLVAIPAVELAYWMRWRRRGATVPSAPQGDPPMTSPRGK